MPFEIHNWCDIANEFQHTIILGNGASISINNSFTYSSLKEHAVQEGLLTDNVKKLFGYFNTEDFELVLRLVWQANKVNLALDIKDETTKDAYEHVRNCLIEAVRSIHPEYHEVEEQLPFIAEFLKDFETILSLNYDLTLYWVIMYSNRVLDGHKFKDCIINSEFDDDWQRFRESLGDNDRNTTLVFYPHGSLVLARNVVEIENKLTAGVDSDLLRSILHLWVTGSFIPLFVSEGTSSQKINAIQNSHYLYTVYREVLPSLENSLVIYGWGFGEHDIHIVNRLKESNISRVAISVLGNDQAYCTRVSQIIFDIFDRNIDVKFFDSLGDGCWNNRA